MLVDVNTQYVGARYVPKFYDNPDDHSTNWKANQYYESFIVVTDPNNGNSYTSKKPVPPNIGTPSENPLYWAKTGDFNASLIALQDRVNTIEHTIGDETLETEAQTITGAVNEVDEKTKLLSVFVTPEMFGAIGDGVADDTVALQNALNDPHDLIGSGNYRITSGLTATAEKNINLSGSIICDGIFDGITIGNATPHVDDRGWFIHKTIRINSVRKNAVDWVNSNTGVKLINVWRALVTVNVSNFETGIELEANNYGLAWNIFTNLCTFDCKTSLKMTIVGSGWNNQNTFIGGSVTWAHSVVIANTTTTDPVVGIDVKGGENSFYNFAVDGGGTSTSDYDYYTGLICDGNYNHFNELRFERVSAINVSGNYNTIDNPYLFPYTTVTRSSIAALSIKSNSTFEIYTDTTGNMSEFKSHHNGATFIAGFNPSNVQTLEISDNGVIKSAGSHYAYDGCFKIGKTSNPDDVSSELPNGSAYAVFNSSGSNPGVGIVFGVKYSATDESQLSFGLYGTMNKRLKSGGTWGAWLSVT